MEYGSYPTNAPLQSIEEVMSTRASYVDTDGDEAAATESTNADSFRPSSSSFQTHHLPPPTPSPQPPTPQQQQLLQTISELDGRSTELQQEGQLLESLQLMEQSLLLRGSLYGLHSEEVYTAASTICQMCNYLSMIYLSHHSLPITLDLLKKAEVLAQNQPALQAITYNNYACYYRKTGKLRIALKYALKSLESETHVNGNAGSTPAAGRVADTQLNVCTILSELKRYSEALIHAKLALKLLLLELFGERDTPDNTHMNSTQQLHQADVSGDAEGGAAGKAELPIDRVSVLAIAYHNLAVQQEHLSQYNDSLVSYQKALKVVTTHLGDKHPLAASMKQSVKDATATFKPKLEQQAAKQQAEMAKNALKKPALPATMKKSVSGATLNGSMSMTSILG